MLGVSLPFSATVLGVFVSGRDRAWAENPWLYSTLSHQ